MCENAVRSTLFSKLSFRMQDMNWKVMHMQDKVKQRKDLLTLGTSGFSMNTGISFRNPVLGNHLQGEANAVKSIS